MKIRFILNGETKVIDVEADRRVIDVIREDLGLTGTKEACGRGECGSCTILVDGSPKLSCLMLAAQLEGREIITIEGIKKDSDMHPIQEAFIKHGAVQCGFCTPGMVLVSFDLLKRNKKPSRDEIREAISGNLCRCTGYQKIVDAIEAAAKREL
ncbi:MAG: (2Fe-2S)-binding protein [Deltaproteobacteria bacterium]|nr:(2Fe-2S)-binding protein [Deltaproteobacteria bacterium]